MTILKRLLNLFTRVLAALLVFAMVTLLSGMLSAWYVSRHLATVLQTDGEADETANQSPRLRSEIDFYKVSGIQPQELDEFLRTAGAGVNQRGFPVTVTLQNESGDYLADSPVIVHWSTGEERVDVGRSGLIQFHLRSEMLDGFMLQAPRGFTHLKQRSIPLGPAYEPERELDNSQLVDDIVWDRRIRGHLLQQLEQLRTEGNVIPVEVIQKQLRRESTTLSLSKLSDQPELSPAEVFRQRKNSVVVVGTLFADGSCRHATGCVLTSSGVILTAYHVLAEPAVSRGVLTLEGKVYPISEVLAASKSADLALVKIPAQQLRPAPLSKGDRVGSPVTVVSHPGTTYFNLTQGYISRYWASTEYGHLEVRMAVTAEFAKGSSGGPVFNSRGEVTGVVLATDTFGNQMVYRTAAPVSAIRSLLREPDPTVNP